MKLANFDIQHELKLQFATTLSSSSFSELKKLVLNKTAIHSVHEHLKNLLSDAVKQDEIEAVTALEKAAYAKQVKEDASEKERDISSRHIDETDKDSLLREHEAKRLEQSGLKREQLVNEVLVQSPGPGQVIVHQHPLSTPIAGSNLHTHMNSYETKRQLDERIAVLSNDMLNINSKLNKIEQRNKEREKRREKRESRLQARVEYAQNGTGIAATLAAENQSRLLSDLGTTKRKIQQNCFSLIDTAERSNYSIFLEQLELYLNSTNTRPSQEQEALRNLLKLIKINLIHDEEVLALKERLDSAQTDLKQQQYSLQLTRQKLDSLIKANPDLLAENEQLQRDNKELGISQEQNVETRNSLFYNTLIFAGLSLVATIPLFLVLAGITATFVLPLLIIPPVLLLAAGIGFGIASMVYAIKGAINGYSIGTNKETIATNSARMVDNDNEVDSINKVKIPELERKITGLKDSEEQLTVALQQEEKRAAETFSQAKRIELPTYSSSSLFDMQRVAVHPLMQNQDFSPSAPPAEEGMFPQYH